MITNSVYEEMDDISKVLISLLVNTLDDRIANKFTSKEDIEAYVSKMITVIRDNEDVQDAMIDIFSIDKSKFSTDELNEVIDSYIGIIADRIDEDPAQLKIRLDI